jgi:hypothetical protein
MFGVRLKLRRYMPESQGIVGFSNVKAAITSVRSWQLKKTVLTEQMLPVRDRKFNNRGRDLLVPFTIDWWILEIIPCYMAAWSLT